MGNSGQGAVLAGQVQGVKGGGQGIEIASDGTISFNSSTAVGVIKTNNPAAFNNYTWPGAISNDAFLWAAASGTSLSWISRGFGLSVSGNSIKPTIPFGQFSDPEQEIEENIPPIGPGSGDAAVGSLYWNTTANQLYICVGSEWVEASYGPLDLSEELLSGTFTLYVNPEIGEDVFVTGERESGFSNQNVTAGYTPQRPFKTIQRAAIEVARIQNGLGQDALAYDRYVIRCSPGTHFIDNRPGDSSVSAWVSDPDVALEFDELKKLNTVGKAGVILPRGVSVLGEDYRKTIIRPLYVPPKTGNFNTGRGSIFRVTGGAFFFDFTFKDKEGLNSSHHLLDCFSYVSKTDLEEYYEKTKTIFSQSYDNDSVEPGETEIVAPLSSGAPDELTDGVTGSSTYIFNCAVRSLWGLCGINSEGDQVTGFKSIVTAQFTGVSLQKDPYCWQKYNPFTFEWEALSGLFYDEYIQLSPNDIRMNPERVSFHIRATKDAFIQEVSVFAIGQGIHHLTESGAEITVTNSNSSFGGCAAVSRGYKSESFPQDKNWSLSRIRVPLSPQEKTGNIKRIYLGNISSVDSEGITLNSGLAVSSSSSSVPENLLREGYSFLEDSYIWVENPLGSDWRTTLAANAWNSADSDRILVNDPLTESGTEDPVPVNPGSGVSLAVGKRVYLRRLVDTRTPSERRMSLLLNNTASVRIPERNYVLQTDPLRAGGAVSRELLSEGEEVLTINSTGIGPDPGFGVSKTCEITLRRSSPSTVYSENTFYRSGEIVKYSGKHYQANKTFVSSGSSPSSRDWGETFVHMPSEYNPEDPQKNEFPTIVFDYDADGDVNSSDLGIPWSTVWTSGGSIQDQYRSGTDYRGSHSFLVAMGYSESEAHSALRPRSSSNRERNPSSSVDFPSAPSGGAATGRGNWALEFRRPSVLRLYGHAWEWTGYLNYSKSLPAFQKDISPQNKFTYYFTNDSGGRVVPQGSNEEGFNITPRGLEDVETGNTLSVENLGGLSIGSQSNIFPNGIIVGGESTISDLTFTGSITSSGPESKARTEGRYGLSGLASTEQIAEGGRSSESALQVSDTDINNASDQTIVLPALERWRAERNLLSGAQPGATLVVLHVAPNEASAILGPGGTPSEGSIPFGYVTEGHTYDPSANGYQGRLFPSVTEALKEASRIYVPVGSEIVVSVHSNINTIEDGPLTLGSGVTPWVLAGARGASNPKVRIKRTETTPGTVYLPQVDTPAYIVGGVIADIEVEVDCDGETDSDFYLTLDGGFGVGERDVTVRWKNVASGTTITNATCTYGGKIQTRVYSSTESSTDLRVRTILEKAPGSSPPEFFRMFGASGGLLGHGADIVYDLKSSEYGQGSTGTLVFKFQHDFTSPVPLVFYGLGGRGGCKTGTRAAPVLSWDFSGNDWNLQNFIDPDFYENANLNGLSFSTRPLTTSLSADYGINSSTASTFAPIQLRKGCQLDIGSEPLKRAGAFSLLLAVENQAPIPAVLITARNYEGAYVHGGSSSRNITSPPP